MNWDALGVLVEGIAAVAVVVSLLFLVFEVRRNTAAQNDANYGLSVDLSQRFLQTLLADPELALIWENGTRNGELTEAERARFHLAMWQLARSCQNIVYMAEKGRFPLEEWNGYRDSIVEIFALEGSRIWWTNQEWRFSQRFRNLINERIKNNAA
ncbi:MAG: hypothetical protein ACU84Q_20600 [Gammaproteobacteria bacterium]